MDDFMKSPAYERVIFGQCTEGDKEWLAMLWAVFKDKDMQAMTAAGMDTHVAREFFGLVSLAVRYDKS